LLSIGLFRRGINFLEDYPMEDALLSVTDAAKRLGGISKWTIHAWLSQGRLRRTKVGGRTMIRESELVKVIEDGGISPSPRRQTRAGGNAGGH
jgi:excisionase family DNA binding protein